MQFYTGYYASKKLDRTKHYLVRTSVGANRWCPTDFDFPLAAPFSQWIGLPEAEYRPLYIAMLDGYVAEHGLAEIEGHMQSLYDLASAEGKIPVLLCFEALKKPGEFCHRRMFAEWYESKTGLVIPEL